MTSQKTPSPSPLIDQLRANALAAVGRQGFHALAQHLDAGRAEDHANRAELNHLRVATTAGAPPAELTHAMRAPRGLQRLVRLRVCGRSIRTVINPLGYPEPLREHAVWIHICSIILLRVIT